MLKDKEAHFVKIIIYFVAKLQYSKYCLLPADISAYRQHAKTKLKENCATE